MKGIFESGQPAADRLVEWWIALDGDPGGRAELRRCRSEMEAAMHPAVARFCYRLRPHMAEERAWEGRVAMILGLAAHLDPHAMEDVLHSTKTIPERMAQGERPRVSELRFRRLLQRRRHELYAPMVRLLRLLDHRVGLLDLASTVYYWGDGVRREWAYTYFPLVPAKRGE